MSDHANRHHAFLSASGADRWLSCTPSARLEAKYLDTTPEKESDFAKEGTLAHELAELELLFSLQRIDKKAYDKEFKKISKSKYYAPEMKDYVDGYCSIVLDKYEQAMEADPGAEIYLESRLDYSHVVEGGFGTGDVCIVTNGVVMVIDLKYGKGVKVDKEGNPQLRLYAVGAVRQFEVAVEIHRVVTIIIQPRLNHIHTEMITVKDLNEWCEDYVRPRAEMAHQGIGQQVVGDYCKFCKVQGLCRAYADKMLEVAQEEFRDPHLLGDAELLKMHKYMPMLTAYAQSVNDYLLSQALIGKKFKGYKVVEGISKRSWSDEVSVSNRLYDAGFDPQTFTVTKLRGIADVQKVTGKEFYEDHLAALVVKPQGKPTLVPESDPRPEFNDMQIQSDFGEPMAAED
jgi:hypothetical protein